MKDRFKFRFWFKDTQEMIYSEKFNDVQTLGQWLFEDRKDVVKMQSTGLKDKNGKLIYEGDIVNVKIDGWEKSYIPMVVVWDRKEWQLKQYNKNFKQNCSACEVKRKQKCQYCSQYFSATGHTNFKDFYNNEVIGNIYENKELLNEI